MFIHSIICHHNRQNSPSLLDLQFNIFMFHSCLDVMKQTYLSFISDIFLLLIPNHKWSRKADEMGLLLDHFGNTVNTRIQDALFSSEVNLKAQVRLIHGHIYYKNNAFIKNQKFPINISYLQYLSIFINISIFLTDRMSES